MKVQYFVEKLVRSDSNEKFYFKKIKFWFLNVGNGREENSLKCHLKWSIYALKGKIKNNTFYFCKCWHELHSLIFY